MRLPLKLRRPQEIIWLLAILLVLVGLLVNFGVVIVPIAGVGAFWYELVAAVLMILGTWLF